MNISKIGGSLMHFSIFNQKTSVRKLITIAYLILLQILSCFQAKAQCQTRYETIDTSKHLYAISAAFESIYKNEDLENGFISYNLRAEALFKRGEPHAPVSYFIECYYTKSNNFKDDIVPRTITFHFGDGTTSSIDASRELSANSVEGGVSRKFFYAMNDTQSNVISSKEIRTIDFMDRRTGNSLSATNFYAKILLEQMDCLRRGLD